MVAAFRFALGGNHLCVFGNEETNDLYGFVDDTSAIAAQVDDEAFDMVGLYHAVECHEELLCGVGCELAEENISDRVFNDGGDADCGKVDIAACDLLGDELAVAFYDNLDGSASFTA